MNRECARNDLRTLDVKSFLKQKYMQKQNFEVTVTSPTIDQHLIPTASGIRRTFNIVRRNNNKECLKKKKLIFCLLETITILPPPSPSSEAQILVPRPKSQSHGPNPIQKAQILASRPKF